MSRRGIVYLVAVVLLLFGAFACQQAKDTAEGAGEKMAEAAEGMQDAAGEMAEAAGEMGGEMMDQAKAAAEKLGAEAQQMYESVSSSLAEKKDELGQLKDKLADMSPEDMMSGEGKAAKEDASRLEQEISELKAKLQGMIDEAGQE